MSSQPAPISQAHAPRLLPIGHRLASTSSLLDRRTSVAENPLNRVELVWNSYGIRMEPLWYITPTSLEQRTNNTNAIRT
jgi:hypothetical protein